MLLPAIISSLVLIQNVVTTSSEPPTEKVSGPNDPQIITSPAYIANNTEFERTCKIYGGDDLPGLVWQDDAGKDIANNPPRIIIELTKDTVKNTTIGIFKLKPALVEDNKFKKITCRNTKQRRAKHFNLKVIPDQSVPEISVNNGIGSLKKFEGDTVQIQCTMSGKTSNIVKKYSLTWAVNENNNAGCYDKPSLKISNSEIVPTQETNGSFISILKIKGLNLAHAKRYFCIACLHLIGDEIGSFNTFVDLMVKRMPNVKKELRVQKDTSTELDCEAVGKSTNATWVRVSHWNGEVIDIPADNASIFNNRFSFKPSGSNLGSAPNSILEISSVQITDRAVYRCSVQFSEQNVTKEFTLRVWDRSGFYWPVAGMFGEATLLFLIIVLCDSYHQKKKFRENPPPPSEEDEADVAEGQPLMNNGVPLQPLPVTEILA